MFIDARHIFRQVDRAHRDFTDTQIEGVANIARLWRGEQPEYYFGSTDWMREHFPDLKYRVFLGIGNITEDGHLDLSSTRHIAAEDFPQWTKRVVPKGGDIVFTYEATLNRYAIIPDGFEGCLGRRLALIRPDSRKVNTRFLHYVFFSSDWRSTIERNCLAGATVDRIPLTKFPTFPVNVPELPIQNSIASILSAYDDLIEVNQRRIAILEETARRIFDEWFVHFRCPGRAAIPLDETALGGIPNGWKPGVIEDIVVLQRGFDLPSALRNDGLFPIIAATGEHGRHSEFKVRGPGVVTGRSGSLGKVMHIEGDFWPLNTTLWGKEFPLGSTYFAYFVLRRLPFNTLMLARRSRV